MRLSSFTPSADHGVVEGAAVDRGVGADFDIVADDDAANLRDLDPAAVRVRAKPRPSAPITAPECRDRAGADGSRRLTPRDSSDRSPMARHRHRSGSRRRSRSLADPATAPTTALGPTATEAGSSEPTTAPLDAGTVGAG